MRWTPGGTSGDIEDRRNDSGGGGFPGGGGFGGIHLGIGGILVLLVLSFIFKRDLISPLLNSGAVSTAERPCAASRSRPRCGRAEGSSVRLLRAR